MKTSIVLDVEPEEARALLHGLGLVVDLAEEVADRTEDGAAARRMRSLVACLCETIAEVEGQTGEDRDSFGADLAAMMLQCH